jgi:hypothetical protein
MAEALERKANITRPADFAEARSALTAASRGIAVDARSAEAAYHAFAEEQLVMPLVKAAQACADPYERALHLAAAQVMSRTSDLDAAQLREGATSERGNEHRTQRAEEQRRLRAEFLKIVEAIDGRRHAWRRQSSRG